MKCPKCGSENPDYAFFCGKCAGDLKVEVKELAKSSPTPALPTIESMVSKYILKIQENASKKRKGLLGGGIWYGTIVFSNDRETITLLIEKDGHAAITRGAQSKKSLELKGPHEAFLEMFRDQKTVGRIPKSVSVAFAGFDQFDSIQQELAREGAWKMLRRTFE